MKRLRISLSTIMLLVVIAALGVALALSRIEASRARSQLQNVVPIPELDIAVQVERQAAQAGLPIDTTQILLDPIGPTYVVGFTYIHPDDGIPVSATVKLLHEKDGRYVGYIREEPFLKPVADQDGERGLRVTAVDKAVQQALGNVER